MWAAGPFHPHAVDHDIVRALGLDPVPTRVFHAELAQHHIIAGDQQSFARALLAGKVQDRPIHPRAAQRHAIDIKAKPVSQQEPARFQHDLVARRSQDQRFLQALLRAIARRDRMGFGKNRRSACEKHGGK
ncbi:hypothetical protein [Altererythrobacter sp. BO-6]|uniref:hypothetical protein n=1 Tax=Altererythrobacter sp. BO-6 TaxID=2604537 RepID=UPI002407BBF8|nr:hypothetical protein [Altererythrobacter sp. BO-6]